MTRPRGDRRPAGEGVAERIARLREQIATARSEGRLDDAAAYAIRLQALEQQHTQPTQHTPLSQEVG